MSTNTIQLFNLAGKKALVTGCNKGIGKAMAMGLAEAGADIVGVSGSLEAEGSEISQLVATTGRKFYPYRADLSDRASLYAFIDSVNQNHEIDILSRGRASATSSATTAGYRRDHRGGSHDRATPPPAYATGER